MKKFVLVLMLALMFVMPVMAQTAEETTHTAIEAEHVYWDDLEEDFVAKGMDGFFYDIRTDDFGMKLMIPDGMEQSSYENMEQDGVVTMFATEDGSKKVFVTYRDLATDTYEGLVELLNDNYDNVFYKPSIINDLNTLIFYIPDQDTMTGAILVDGTNFVQVSITPMTDEALNAYSGFILGSIQPLGE